MRDSTYFKSPLFQNNMIIRGKVVQNSSFAVFSFGCMIRPNRTNQR